MSRGARRAPIFQRDEDCELFLECVEEAAERFGVEVHAYSLMPNHYHLLVRSMLGNLSSFMRQVNGLFTRRLNRAHHWDGPVFRGRYRSQLVYDGIYLEHVFAYVHLNPLRAGLAKRLDDDCWTSLRVYLRKQRAPDWLTTDFFTRSLGGPAGIRRMIAIRRKRPEEWPDGMDLEGGWLARPTSRPAGPPVAARRRREKTPATLVLDKACAVASCTRADLRRREFGPRANPARRFAAWALSRAGGYSEREIGQALGMTANQVAKVLHRFRRDHPPEPVRSWMRQFLATF